MLASQAIVSVCDTGVGIPEEHISKILRDFIKQIILLRSH